MSGHSSAHLDAQVQASLFADAARTIGDTHARGGPARTARDSAAIARHALAEMNRLMDDLDALVADLDH